MTHPLILAPSLLACDFANLAQQIKACEQGGAEWLHFDVMDGHFVPNLSIGLPVLEATRRSTKLFLDVHLMVASPEPFLEAFAKAGADQVTVHAEATPHAHSAIQKIKSLGLKAGLVCNPATPLEHYQMLLPEIDTALVMGVNPGFGGQKFIASTPARIAKLREWRDQLNPSCRIEVDGGLNITTVRACVEAGADTLVVGSAVFSGPIVSNIQHLLQAAQGQ